VATLAQNRHRRVLRHVLAVLCLVVPDRHDGQAIQARKQGAKMSETETYYRLPSNIVENISSLVQDTEQVIKQSETMLLFATTRKAQQAIRRYLRATRLFLRISKQIHRLIKKHQRWWANDEIGGWCYPSNVAYALIAIGDQLEAAISDMTIARVTADAMLIQEVTR
jgi:hypothetical protein